MFRAKSNEKGIRTTTLSHENTTGRTERAEATAKHLEESQWRAKTDKPPLSNPRGSLAPGLTLNEAPFTTKRT